MKLVVVSSFVFLIAIQANGQYDSYETLLSIDNTYSIGKSNGSNAQIHDFYVEGMLPISISKKRTI